MMGLEAGIVGVNVECKRLSFSEGGEIKPVTYIMASEGDQEATCSMFFNV